MSEDALDDDNATLTNVTSTKTEIPITYTVFVPIFIAACVVTFVMNAVILAAFPFIRNLSRVSVIHIAHTFLP